MPCGGLAPMLRGPEEPHMHHPTHVLAIALALGTLGFVGVAPEAQAACLANVALSTCHGECTVNGPAAECGAAGTCVVNAAGSCEGHCDVSTFQCAEGAGCTVNLEGTCEGDCGVNVMGECGPDGWCLVNVEGTCEGGCMVNVAAHCGPAGRCPVNVLSNCFSLP